MSDFDPNLTAYALSELTGDEHAAARAAVEAVVAVDPQAAAFVIATRAAAGSLASALSSDVSPGLDDVRLATLLAAADAGAPVLSLASDEDTASTDATGTSLYHVIRHPMAEPRRWRRTLFAVAASVAVVASALTAILSSAFRHMSVDPVASRLTDQSSPAPTIVFLPHGDFGTSADTDPLPGVSDSIPWLAKAPRDLLPDPDAHGRSPLFGVGPVMVIPLRTGPSTTKPTSDDRSGYAISVENPFIQVSLAPTSAVPLRVGSASYPAIRRAIEAGRLPAHDSVRVEELINYFPYHDPAPAHGEAMTASLEAAACPWETSHRLVRLGLKARTGSVNEVVARAAAMQIEFNPAAVGAYRLIGFDRRLSTQTDESGSPDRDITAGQAMTALYEIIPATPGAVDKRGTTLKYQTGGQLTSSARTGDLLTVTLRYQDAATSLTRSQDFTVTDSGAGYAAASADFQFAAAAASFGLILRESPHRGSATFDMVLALAAPGLAADELGARAEFVRMVKRATLLRA